MPHLLLLEDEPAIAETLIYALETEHFSVEWLTLGQAGLQRLHQGGIDLLVLDVGLPDLSGLDVCRELRRQPPPLQHLPLLFLTARSSEVDRILGLEMGGDDYVTKPFSPREVVARIRAILKRSQLNPHAATLPPTPAAPAVLQVQAHLGWARCYGELLKLTRYELLLLDALCSQPGRIFSRAQLMDRIWTDAWDSDERTVDTHIKTLRAKLRAASPSHAAQMELIQTHRGLGYSLQLPEAPPSGAPRPEHGA